MSGIILVVRPEPGLASTLTAAEELGLNAVGYPLFEIQPVDWECPDPSKVEALLIGSANAIRHGGAALSSLTDKPVYAVGQATGDAALEADFKVATIGTGGLQNVLAQVPAGTKLLRLAGAEHVPLEAPKDVSLVARVIYKAVPLELPEPLRALQELGLTVLLHSAAAARQFDRDSGACATNPT